MDFKLIFRRIAIRYRNYFGFSKTETRGSIVLMLLMLLVVVIYGIRRESMFSGPDNRVKDSLLLVQIHQLLEDNLLDSVAKTSGRSPAKPLTTFDPNTVTYDWLVSRGIDKGIASNWVNYLKKGGNFKNRSEIRKIYGLTDSLYQMLDAYIKIPAKATGISQSVQNKTLIDINTTDTTTLKSVRGIGGKLSTRIINFRDRLGGFTSMNQLYEVYYLDSSIVALTKKKFFVSPDFIPRKIYINKITEENLAKHPYLTYKEAKLVILYREQHGDFEKVDELLNIPVISMEKLKKIEPYIGIVDQ